MMVIFIEILFCIMVEVRGVARNHLVGGRWQKMGGQWSAIYAQMMGILMENPFPIKKRPICLGGQWFHVGGRLPLARAGLGQKIGPGIFGPDRPTTVGRTAPTSTPSLWSP